MKSLYLTVAAFLAFMGADLAMLAFRTEGFAQSCVLGGFGISMFRGAFLMFEAKGGRGAFGAVLCDVGFWVIAIAVVGWLFT